MASRSDITPELCRQLLRYEPETGRLYWRPRPLSMFPDERAWRIWNTRFADKPALDTISRGYRIGSIHYQMFKAHRVVWAMHHGDWPEVIDHINGDPGDNRIENLRSGTQADNLRNVGAKSNSRTGKFGVHRMGAKWSAEIKVSGKKIWLGSFDTFEEATAARTEAERKFGYSERHGVARRR